MKKPHEFLTAISENRELNWQAFLDAMAKEKVLPGAVCRVFTPLSVYAKTTRVTITSPRDFQELRDRFPESLPIVGRISASAAGDSHLKPVDGSLFVVYNLHWPHPQVAVSWSGGDWTPWPEPHQHLVIVENMQNFLRFRDTLALLRTRCGLDVAAESILLAFGSGNACTKSCNAQYYVRFASVNCLFDLDCGAIKIYSALKNLLAPHKVHPRFLVPDDVSERLARSKWHLSHEERTVIYQACVRHPELSKVLAHMYHSHKKLEQETYLEAIDE